jgi:hypothetical protein
MRLSSCYNKLGIDKTFYSSIVQLVAIAMDCNKSQGCENDSFSDGCS